MKLLSSLMGLAVPNRPAVSAAKINPAPPRIVNATVAAPLEASHTITVHPSMDTRFVIDRVFSADNTQQRKRIDTEYIHVSSLKDICPRQYALMAKLDEPFYDKVYSSDRIIWAIGRAVENHIRKSFISAVDFSGVIGKWACRCGASEVEGFHVSGSECGVCGSALDYYKELPLFDHDNKIVGNPDMLFEHDGLVYVVEIKSIKGGEASTNSYKGFVDLEHPMGDHVFQAQMYRYLLRKNGYRVADEVILIYGSKDYMVRKEPLKEFHVDVSGAEYEEQVSLAVANAKAVFSYLDGSGELPAGVCQSVSNPKAKLCPVAGRCFHVS